MEIGDVVVLVVDTVVDVVSVVDVVRVVDVRVGWVTVPVVSVLEDVGYVIVLDEVTVFVCECVVVVPPAPLPDW